MLCQVCREVFSNPGVRGPVSVGFRSFPRRYNHHVPPSALKVQAEAGCYICRRIWKQLLPVEKLWVLSMCSLRYFASRLASHTLFFFTKQQPRTGTGSDLLRVLFPDYINFNGTYGWEFDSSGGELKFVFGASDRGWKTVAFDLIAANEVPELRPIAINSRAPSRNDGTGDVPLREMLLDFDPAPTTNSAKTWSFVMERWQSTQHWTTIKARWLPEYSAVQRKTMPDRPTRLLDVSGNVLKLSLASARAQQGDEPYTTLSYRWEAQVPCAEHDQSQLKKERIEHWTQYISEAALPQTYQDAIYVVRSLGIRYLWIDALCIIKDDEEDFQQEASRMSAIYRAAVLNIAAGDGNRHSGLFRSRSRAQLMPETVDVQWRGFAQYYSRSARDKASMQGQFYILESDYRANALLRADCNSRGWVVQERLLSPCTLHFGRDQVFWESYDASCCELFPHGYPMTFQDSHTRLADLTPYRDMLNRPPSRNYWTEREESNQRDQSWRGIVELYSRTDVTFQRDRMIALSGLAKEWSELVRDWQIISPDISEYAAGLWHSEMPWCLLWRVKDGRKADGTPSNRQPHTTAPSWSWLSVSGVITTPENDVADRFTNLVREWKIDMRPRDSTNPFGLLIPNQSILEMTAPIYRPRRLFWPPSAMNEERAGSDRSQITAVGLIADLFPTCSIDDMRAFQQQWDNSSRHFSMPYGMLRRLGLAIIRYAPIWAPLLALLANLWNKHHSLAYQVGFGIFYAICAYLISVSMAPYFPRFWYCERGNVCFLGVSNHYGSVDGLVLQEVSGDDRKVYRRIGMFHYAPDWHFDTQKPGKAVVETIRII